MHACLHTHKHPCTYTNTRLFTLHLHITTFSYRGRIDMISAINRYKCTQQDKDWGCGWGWGEGGGSKEAKAQHSSTGKYSVSMRQTTSHTRGQRVKARTASLFFFFFLLLFVLVYKDLIYARVSEKRQQQQQQQQQNTNMSNYFNTVNICLT